TGSTLRVRAAIRLPSRFRAASRRSADTQRRKCPWTAAAFVSPSRAIPTGPSNSSPIRLAFFMEYREEPFSDRRFGIGVVGRICIVYAIPERSRAGLHSVRDYETRSRRDAQRNHRHWEPGAARYVVATLRLSDGLARAQDHPAAHVDRR